MPVIYPLITDVLLSNLMIPTMDNATLLILILSTFVQKNTEELYTRSPAFHDPIPSYNGILALYNQGICLKHLYQGSCCCCCLYCEIVILSEGLSGKPSVVAFGGCTLSTRLRSNRVARNP
jgi:hypothetical protein